MSLIIRGREGVGGGGVPTIAANHLETCNLLTLSIQQVIIQLIIILMLVSTYFINN